MITLKVGVLSPPELNHTPEGKSLQERAVSIADVEAPPRKKETQPHSPIFQDAVYTEERYQIERMIGEGCPNCDI